MTGSATPERRWGEVADGVWVCRHRNLDLTTGVVIGADAMLVIDTGADIAAGRGLAEDIRGLTPAARELPLSVVYSHAHYDHCFGTEGLAAAAAGPGLVLGHVRCRAELAEHGALQRDTAVAELRGSGRDAAAERLAAVRPVLPNRVLTTAATVELGGRDVSIAHLGRGHTDHDVVVLVPDVDVVFAGDLLENGAPPAFEDSFPADWPVTLTGLLELLGPAGPATTAVPGHGDPVDEAFVRAQRDDLAAVAAACATGTTDAGPYPAAVMRTALAAFRSTAQRSRV